MAVDLYETDFVEWASHNAELLRSGRLAEADIENIAEEIDSLGRSQSRELESRVIQIMEHLLKLRLAPEETRHLNSRLWRAAIERQRREIQRLFKASPSLRSRVNPELLAACYADAAGIFEAGFEIHPPAHCPFSEGELLGEQA